MVKHSWHKARVGDLVGEKYTDTYFVILKVHNISGSKGAPLRYKLCGITGYAGWTTLHKNSWHRVPKKLHPFLKLKHPMLAEVV